MRKGQLITFEGIDGSGKTTQLNLLADYLRRQNEAVVVLREPGGTELGEAVRSLLLSSKYKKMSDRSELYLFLAARAQLCNEVIAPALSLGKFVLCDRFIDSTIAYQGYGRGLDPATLKSLNSMATAGISPNITFYLRIPVATAVERMMVRDIAPDRMEAQADHFRQAVVKGYDVLAATEPRFVTIKADQSIENIHGIILNEVRRFIYKEDTL